MPRLLRAIRFDPSDTHVFPRAAGDAEWAIPGSFVFAHGRFRDPAELKGKERQAFVSGFLGIGSFGFSTLVSVAEAKEDEIDACVAALSRHLMTYYGAPSEAAARDAAVAEVGFGRELAEGVPLNTLLALKRAIDASGAIKESFHVVAPPGEPPHARIWDIVEET